MTPPTSVPPPATLASSAPVAPLRSGRRLRLARLREETEPLVAEERQAALRTLLRHPLLTPATPDPSAFTLVRRHREHLADWFAHHADWSLTVTPDVIRLRKSPAPPATDPTRPATDPRSDEPFTRTRYVVFCLLLATLERGERQITLGRLAEGVAADLAAEPAFAAAGLLWSLDDATGRRDFVHTLRLLLSLGVLRRIQGDEERSLHDRANDALYNIERPVLAALLAARRSPSLIDENSPASCLAALLDPALPDSPEARNRALRTRLVRRLLDDPVLYLDTLTADERAYLERQRGHLLSELADATGLIPEIRAEGLALTDLEGDCTDFGLPEEGTEGHLTLLLATWLADQLRAAPAATVSTEAFRQQTARFIRRHKHHWRKDASEKGAELPLSELVLHRLDSLALIARLPDGTLRPLPAIGRFALRASPELAELPDDLELPLS